MDKYFFQSLLLSLPISLVIVVVIVILFLKNPEKVQIWVGLIAGWFSSIMKTSGYYSIKNEVEGKINSYLVEFENNTNSTFPRARIKWVGREEKEEIIFEDYETIIVIRNKEHRNKNFVHAAYFFTSQVLLNKIKDKLSLNQKKALDLFATKNLLEHENKASVEQFISDYLKPEIEKNNSIKTYISKFIDIDKAGIFFPVLIKELDYLGKKIVLSNNTKGEIINEARNLIDYLHNYSNRKSGDLTQETFVGVHMKCAIKIIATAYSRAMDETEGQARRIIRSFNNGCEDVYIIGRVEDGNRDFMKRVSTIVIENNDNEKSKSADEVEFNCFIKNCKGKQIKVKTLMIHFHCLENIKSIY